jgi:tRNA U34 2-thiouridine synthase MnmA/TrmU
MNRKAISLLSGGLDSLLATKLIMEQGIELVALHFTSPFCTCTKGDKGCGLQAVKTARELDIEVMVKVKGLEYLEIVKAPRHGYGKNLNPCIDCRIFMLKEVRKLMAEIDASFVVTGEVLGQRPMSQRRDAIRLIEKESGLEGLIVRPLSAKHFEPTLPEREGILDREKLLDISGRTRRPQYDLAESFRLKEFSCPGGGCLLTDPIFARKLKDLFAHSRGFTMKDVALLKIGRHFRLNEDTKLVLGRNENENKRLEAANSDGCALLTPIGFKGPQGLLFGVLNEDILRIAGNLMAYYGKMDSFPVSIESNNGVVARHTINRTLIEKETLMI